MSLQERIIQEVTAAAKTHYGADLSSVELQATRKDFEGDITVVIFPMLRYIKGNPVAIGQTFGEQLQASMAEVD
ncbi:MAG: arginine--tRNA ligase, partial [Flavobacteriaceae bacterium]|nr:arginine--tRNA ligase [Flavobacteriaceae bacterium]